MAIDPRFTEGEVAIRYGQTFFRVSGSHLREHSPWFCAANATDVPASLPADVSAFFDIPSIDEVYGHSALDPFRLILHCIYAHHEWLIGTRTAHVHFGMLYLARLYHFDAIYINIARVLEDEMPGRRLDDWQDYEFGGAARNVFANLAYESKALPLLPALLYSCAMQGEVDLQNRDGRVGATLHRELERKVHAARLVLLHKFMQLWFVDIAAILNDMGQDSYIRERVRETQERFQSQVAVGKVPNILNLWEETEGIETLDEWVEEDATAKYDLGVITQVAGEGVLRDLPTLFGLESGVSQTESELVRNELNVRVLPWDWKLYY